MTCVTMRGEMRTVKGNNCKREHLGNGVDSHPRLPVGFGTIRYLGPVRRFPYAVHPPKERETDQRRAPAICYVKDWFTGLGCCRQPSETAAKDIIPGQVKTQFPATFGHNKRPEMTGKGLKSPFHHVILTVLRRRIIRQRRIKNMSIYMLACSARNTTGTGIWWNRRKSRKRDKPWRKNSQRVFSGGFCL